MTRRALTVLAGIVALVANNVTAGAQEVLLSPTENYYEFLALNGSLERPYLNYRTLSDSDWDTSNRITSYNVCYTKLLRHLRAPYCFIF